MSRHRAAIFTNVIRLLRNTPNELIQTVIEALTLSYRLDYAFEAMAPRESDGVRHTIYGLNNVDKPNCNALRCKVLGQ